MGFCMALNMNSVGISGGFPCNAGFSRKFGVWGGFGRSGVAKGFCANSHHTIQYRKQGAHMQTQPHANANATASRSKRARTRTCTRNANARKCTQTRANARKRKRKCTQTQTQPHANANATARKRERKCMHCYKLTHARERGESKREGPHFWPVEAIGFSELRTPLVHACPSDDKGLRQPCPKDPVVLKTLWDSELLRCVVFTTPPIFTPL